MRLNVGWPDNSWRPMLFVGDAVVFCRTRAVMWRCWREARREVHLVRFGRYPRTLGWELPRQRSSRAVSRLLRRVAG